MPKIHRPAKKIQYVTLNGAPNPAPEPNLSVRLSAVVDIVRAAHLTTYVESPFEERGGIMFVSPPQHMKSSMIKCLRIFPNALVLSDLNSQRMNDFREDLLNAKYTTVAFLEFNKLYQRNANSAANLEGTIQSVTAEGWTGPSYGDARLPKEEARSLVIGGMTFSTYQARFKEWKEGGFLARFLWAMFRLRNSKALGDAVERQVKIGLGGGAWSFPDRQLRFNREGLNANERRIVREFIQAQPSGSEAIPYSLLLKIGCVLKWHYGERKEPDLHMDVMREFSNMLQNHVATLEVEEETEK